MDTLCMALVGGYVAVAAAIAVLWRAYHKANERYIAAQDARIAREQVYEQTITGLRQLILARRGHGTEG